MTCIPGSWSVGAKVQMSMCEKAGRILLLCMQLEKKEEDKKEKEKSSGKLGKEHSPDHGPHKSNQENGILVATDLQCTYIFRNNMTVVEKINNVLK